MRRAEAALHETLQRLPTVVELAASLGMSEHKVRELRFYRHWKEVESLQGLLEEDEEEERRDFVSLFEQYVNQASWRSERVREAVAAALTKRQQDIIRSRYGMDEQDGREQTQLEVACCYWGDGRNGTLSGTRGLSSAYSGAGGFLSDCGSRAGDVPLWPLWAGICATVRQVPR